MSMKFYRPISINRNTQEVANDTSLTVHWLLNDGTPHLVVTAVRISAPLYKIKY